MLTDLLNTVAEGGRVLLEEKDYLLARVQVDGRPMLAEISRGSSGGIPPGGWPVASGILHPDSEIHPAGEGDTRILLFSVPHGEELYLERIMRDGVLSESQALKVGKKLLGILRRIHDAGFRVGYLGPDNVLVTPEGDHFILGGARGIPDTPFSPPEAVGGTAQDPRSDVYALGLLMFRLIAGSDDRDVQIEAWNRLSDDMMRLLEKMVTPDADDRYPNLMVLSGKLSSLVLGKQDDRRTEVGCRRNGNRRLRGFPGWGYGLAALALAAAVVVAVGPCGGGGEPDGTVAEDTSDAAGDPQAIPDTAVSIPPDQPPPDPENAAEPTIWISNCTGQPGEASEFRQGPVADYSSVYTCTGSRRGSSIILARRNDPALPFAEQGIIHDIAMDLAFADSSITVHPVDITILLGSDLLDDRVAPGIITPTDTPAGTLYVDIANHGVDGVYGGAGAATWTRSVLDGGSLTARGRQWMLRVVDFRNGDMLNDELGIPGELSSTLFLYRSGQPVLSAAETEIRKAILENTLGNSEPVKPDPPDIWVLLGR
ncbi:MAG: hypothetical protein R6U39_06765 [Candidatus Aegiribacteria sp.]